MRSRRSQTHSTSFEIGIWTFQWLVLALIMLALFYLLPQTPEGPDSDYDDAIPGIDSLWMLDMIGRYTQKLLRFVGCLVMPIMVYTCGTHFGQQYCPTTWSRYESVFTQICRDFALGGLSPYSDHENPGGPFSALFSWFHWRGTQSRNIGPSTTQSIDTPQHAPPCSLICYENGQCLGCHVTRSVESSSSEIGYSQPTFPFNILPGRVETSCTKFTGYALERCKNDVKARNQLFVVLAAVLTLVILCVVWMTTCTCIRRMKARRRFDPTLLSKNASHQATGDSPATWKARRSYKFKNRSSTNQKAATSMPLTLDGIIDRRTERARGSASMQQLPGHFPSPGSLRPTARSTAPRIPSLKLPRPIFATTRKFSGPNSHVEGNENENSMRIGKEKEKGKRKAANRVRWDSAV